MAYIDELSKPGYNDNARRLANDLIIDTAIRKAITDKRELLKPSIEHFLQGGNVNGEFHIALKKLFGWVEDKVLEAIKEREGKTKFVDDKVDKITIAKEFLEYAKGSDFLYDFLVSKGYDHDLYDNLPEVDIKQGSWIRYGQTNFGLPVYWNVAQVYDNKDVYAQTFNYSGNLERRIISKSKYIIVKDEILIKKLTSEYIKHGRRFA